MTPQESYIYTLETENAALKQQVSELEHTRDVLHESYVRHLEELDLANQRLVSEEYANSLNNSVIDALREQVEQGKIVIEMKNRDMAVLAMTLDPDDYMGEVKMIDFLNDCIAIAAPTKQE